MAIFKRAVDTGAPNVAPPPKADPSRPARSGNEYVIGSTLVIKGELSAAEDLIIEGQVEGTIAHHKRHLTVGEKGRVKGDIHANSVIVLGQLVGNIHSDGMVSLAKSANVVGNISCARLAVDDGAKIKGNINMAEPPKVKAPVEPARARVVSQKKPQKVAGRTAKPSVY